MDIGFEAWQDRVEPIEIATPLYQYTKTVITFSVLDASRNAVDLTGYAAKFSFQSVDAETEIVDKACALAGDPTTGQCTCTLTSANMASSKECLGELRLWSTGNTSDDVTDRIQFRFNIAKALKQGA